MEVGAQAWEVSELTWEFENADLLRFVGSEEWTWMQREGKRGMPPLPLWPVRRRQVKKKVVAVELSW